MSAFDAAAIAAAGDPIRGPSALGGSLQRFLSLTWTLAVLEFKLKFFGSLLGYLWQLMKPLMLFGVMYVVFSQIFQFGAGVPHYPVVLLSGVVIYTFFSEATSACVSCVVDRENLVRKIHFPRLVIPLAAVLTSFFTFLLNYSAVVVFMLATGVEVRLSWLGLIPLAFGIAMLCAGIGMILAANFVRFRDVRPIWDVVITATFYATPILYPIELVQEKASTKVAELLIMLNPLATLVEENRHLVIDPSAPSAAEAAGGAVRLLIPLTIVLVLLVAGFRTFDRQAPHIAEDL